MTQYTVESMRKDSSGFKDVNGTWYSGKGITIPKLNKGAVVELEGYQTNESNGRTYHNITGVKVINEGEAYNGGAGGAKAGGYKKSGGYDSDGQAKGCALNNAVLLANAGTIHAKTVDDIVAVAQGLYRGMKSFGASAENKEQPVQAAKTTPVAPAQGSDAGTFDDQIPF